MREGGWAQKSVGVPRDLFAAFSNSVYRWVAGACGFIARSDNGAAFVPEPSPTGRTLTSLAGAALDTVRFAAGESGVVLQRAGDGTWSSLPSPSAATIRGLRIRAGSTSARPSLRRYTSTSS